MQTAVVKHPDNIPLGVDFFGVTTGDISLVDVLARILEHTGRTDVDIATWSIGMRSLRRLDMLDIGRVRILIDRSYASRNREYARQLMKIIGYDNVRFSDIHAKFVVAGDVVIHASMNFNTNRRYESVSIHYNADVSRFLVGIIDEWFAEAAINPHNTREIREAYNRHTSDATMSDVVAKYDTTLDKSLLESGCTKIES